MKVDTWKTSSALGSYASFLPLLSGTAGRSRPQFVARSKSPVWWPPSQCGCSPCPNLQTTTPCEWRPKCKEYLRCLRMWWMRAGCARWSHRNGRFCSLAWPSVASVRWFFWQPVYSPQYLPAVFRIVLSSSIPRRRALFGVQRAIGQRPSNANHPAYSLLLKGSRKCQAEVGLARALPGLKLAGRIWRVPYPRLIGG